MKDFVFALKNENSEYIENEEILKLLINENKIHKYEKLPRVNVGDHVICCDISKSIDPNRNKIRFKDYSWEEDKICKVTLVGAGPHVYYIKSTNAPYGIYCSGIRILTPQEIKDYENGIQIKG